jgi:hypothetical protein
MNVLRSALLSAVGLLLSLGLVVANPTFAGGRDDDDDDRRRRGRRDDDDDHDHRRRGYYNHGSRYGRTEWRYVVPHRQNYVGAYFSIGKAHYYTPTPIVPRVVIAGQAPPPVVEVQKPVELKFGGFNRHHDLAQRLVYEANAMCLDMHYNYRNNPDFHHVYREAYDILQAAKFIHAKEHQGNHQAIRERMVAIDRLFHHVEEQMRRWVPGGNRRIGNDQLPEKVANVEAIIHHLCYEVGVQPHGHAEVAPPPVNPNEPAPPPGR